VAKSEVDGRALERDLAYNPDVTAALDKIGKAIADDARVLAPKQTGAGARSIHHEIGFTGSRWAGLTQLRTRHR
jgi:hypothetical protein